VASEKGMAYFVKTNADCCSESEERMISHSASKSMISYSASKLWELEKL
jgi:hypothetical protein